MQISYITVLQFAMALHNYISKVRNVTNFSHANRNYCFQILRELAHLMSGIINTQTSIIIVWGREPKFLDLFKTFI